jgi:heme/copper-type cytochrome/quinol oxidase subunit 4
MQDKKYKGELRRGEIIMLVLVVLNVMEYVLAVTLDPTSTLLIVSMHALALADAVLVIWYYMHLPRAFAKDGEGH